MALKLSTPSFFTLSRVVGGGGGSFLNYIDPVEFQNSEKTHSIPTWMWAVPFKETPDKADEKEVLMDSQKYPSLERKTIVSLHN